MADEPSHPPRNQFADRLDNLFRSIRPGNGRKEYSHEEIARRVGVTGAYIGLLRRGSRGRPKLEVVRKIEKAFGLDQPYLAADDPVVVQETDEQLATFRDLQQRGLLRFAMRARDVRTPEGLAMLDAAYERILELERTQDDDQQENGR